MKPEEYSIMYQVENRHWWYLGMATITKSILNRWYSPQSNLQILDAGCGTGIAMKTYLAELGHVTGFDVSGLAINYCRLRVINRLLYASIIQMPFEQQSFDLVTSFDVLCQIPKSEDIPSLNEIYRVLIPGGRTLIRLPAYHWLYSKHDQAVHIIKRYHAKQIASFMMQSGFILEHISYANTILFPFAFLYRLARKILPHQAKISSDLSINFNFINQMLKMILQLEAKPAAHIGLPYGLSIFAVGRKP